MKKQYEDAMEIVCSECQARHGMNCCYCEEQCMVKTVWYNILDEFNDQVKLLENLNKNWSLSSYNEDDIYDQLDYYFNESECKVGDKAYLYTPYETELTELEIVHIICRSDDTELYDKLLENDDVLIDGECEYNADTSAEFITDNNCYLVWFEYV